MRQTFLNFALSGAVVALFFFVAQQSRETSKLREEAAALRLLIQSLNTPLQLARHGPLEMESNAEKQKAFQENQAEAERLRTEIVRLEAEIARSPRNLPNRKMRILCGGQISP